MIWQTSTKEISDTLRNTTKPTLDLPSSPQPKYRGVTPIASRAAMKVLSLVSRRTKENIPSSMSTNSSPCSSYCQRNMFDHIKRGSKNGSHLIKGWVKDTYKMRYHITITVCSELMPLQLLSQFLVVIYLTINLTNQYSTTKFNYQK